MAEVPEQWKVDALQPTWPQRVAAMREAWQVYRDSWRNLHAPSSESPSTKLDEAKAAFQQVSSELPSPQFAQERLRNWLEDRMSVYQDSLREFIDGYKEGIENAKSSSGSSK
jgi:hypothetical protein